MATWNPTPIPEPVSAPPPATPEKPSAIRRVFVGPGGIRAGWRLLMYLLMVIALGFAFQFVLQGWRPSGVAQLWANMVAKFLELMMSVVPALIMTKVEKRPFDNYGLPVHKAFGKPFWVGAVWGIVAITVLLLGIRGLHGFHFGHLALHGARILKFALFWGAFFLLVGFSEEFLLRGYTLFTLSSGIGFWPSAITLSLLFGLAHRGNPGEDWSGELAAALIGLFFCLTLRRTGDLWFAVGFHASFDWGETFLFSVPNSGTVSPGHLLNSEFHGPRWLTGGSVGPEGSVLVFVLIALLWVVFDRMFREVKYRV